MKELKGIPASSGLAIAKAHKIIEEKINITDEKISDVSLEIKKFEEAKENTKNQIENLKEKTKEKMGEEKAMIFDAHLGILFDIEMENQIKQMIETEKYNSAYAVKEVSENFRNLFLTMEDEYMKERAADILDVRNRLLKNILNIKISDLSLINEEVIIIAHDLTPSETSQLNPKFVKGFITEIGGRTSHSAIMARTLEIPAIVGVGKSVFDIQNDSQILMDGVQGNIVENPSEDLINSHKEHWKTIEKIKKEEKEFINKESKSLDGWKTKIASNVGSPADIEGHVKNGGEGVGLFRSEFLYMDSMNWPTEEEQFEGYKKVIEAVGNDNITVIRTLDIGGDKKLNYFKFPYEMNPFLGYRAIRFQLDKREVLITQARALLRASVFGKLGINVPMIATIEEFKEVQKVFKEVEEQLKSEGIKVGEYQLGIMVEVPSVVEIADKFAKYADFFSIGTNDLIQYTFAADRMSESVSYLYQPFSPIILKKIKKVIDASHKENKWTAICGELAGEIKLAPIFVGMGLDEFSMSSTSIPSIRRIISKINKKDAEKLVEKVLDFETQDEVIKEIDNFLKENNIEIY